MNYTSEELFNKIYLSETSYLSEYEREKTLQDLTSLQELLHPYGILNKISIESLYNVDSKTLAFIHEYQNELFAIKFFRECSKIPTS